MTRLLILLLAEVTAVIVTWQASAPYRTPSWPAWVSTAAASTPADALVGLVHLAALPAACWLLAGTCHDIVTAIAHRHRGGPRHRLVPPWVQRTVDQAVATALAVAVMAGPAAAATTDPVPAVAAVEPPAPPVDLPGASGPETPGLPETAAAGPAIAEAPPAAAPDAQHVVAAGENLWVIARAVLVQRGATPTDREVHAYWTRLIQVNDVPSGDPDLIHPGDVLRLPPTPGPGAQP